MIVSAGPLLVKAFVGEGPCEWRPLWVMAFVGGGLCGWRLLWVKALAGEGLCGWRPLCVSAFHYLCGLWLYIKLLLLLRCWMQWCYLLRFSVMVVVSECYCRCRPFVRPDVREGLCGWGSLWVKAFVSVGLSLLVRYVVVTMHKGWKMLNVIV